MSDMAKPARVGNWHEFGIAKNPERKGGRREVRARAGVELEDHLDGDA